ncbi:MAG TPA: ABC transporter permease [Solimonas sp.]|nr:ABC transporter permease [Solimonas sp.]
MKYFPLIWAALWRRKARTVLTMLSIVVAFLLFGLLQSVIAAFNAGVDISGADRLVTTGKYSLTQMNPYSYVQDIRAVDGVADVSFASWFGGVYQTERNFFAQFPVDPESYLRIYPEVLLPAEQKQAFIDTRTGAIVAKTLADKYHWKVGDKVPILSTIWPRKDGSKNWEFDLVGIFDAKDAATRGQHEYLLFQHAYFDESKPFGNGMVGWFVTRTVDANRNAEVAKAIDAKFRNSLYPTKTDSEKAFNQSFIKQMGDIESIMRGIMGAVFFTLLLLTGNTMAQSVRDRVPELAVLKTIGFSDRSVLALVLVEALLLCLLAAALGLVIASLLAPPLGTQIPGFTAMELKPAAMLAGLALAALLATIVGLPPALKAKRLDIVNALSGH